MGEANGHLVCDSEGGEKKPSRKGSQSIVPVECQETSPQYLVKLLDLAAAPSSSACALQEESSGRLPWEVCLL